MSSGRGSGGHGRRGGRPHEEEEHENHERWAVSYADMMTVLVGLFIVMYAMSTVDVVKYEQLRSSLAAGFGAPAPSILPGSQGAMDGVESTDIVPDLAADAGHGVEQVSAPEPTDPSAPPLTQEERDLHAAVVEVERLEAVADQIAGALAAQQLGDRVRFRITERGLVIGMVADDVFFSPASAELTDTARRVLDTIGPTLTGLPEEISVEGHANNIPVSGRYPTNWELSADRATQVLRRLVEAGGMPGYRIAAVGFGDARPLAETGGVDALDANRRTDVVVLSDVPETVRSLLPSVAAADQR